MIVSWTQWAHDAAHGGSSCVGGQSPGKVLATVRLDPFVAKEDPPSTDNGLEVHYQAPLVVGDDVYVMSKSLQRPTSWAAPKLLVQSAGYAQPVDVMFHHRR